MKKQIFKNEFSSNAFTLLVGTILSQAIPIAVAPLLTRLYSPEEFGLFALYMGIAAILGAIVTGRYDQAIMLPKNDDDAFHLGLLALIITSVISFLILITIIFFNKPIALMLGNPEIERWLYLLPLTIFLSGVYQTQQCWFNRKKKYTLLSKNKVIQSGTMSIVQVSFGSAGSGIFLVFGDIIGKLTSVLNFIFKKQNSFNILSNKICAKNISMVANRYKKFPIYDSLSSLSNISAFQLQNILFPIFYGLSAAGFYFLVLRVLHAPLSIISTSLTDVYKQKLTDSETKPENLKILYKKLFLFLISIGIIPLILFLMCGVELFIFMFGKSWSQAGEYAIILAPMFFIKFIANPLSYFLYVKEKHEVDLVGQVSFILASLGSIFFTETVKDAVISLSISFSFIYLMYLVYSAKLAGVFK